MEFRPSRDRFRPSSNSSSSRLDSRPVSSSETKTRRGLKVTKRKRSRSRSRSRGRRRHSRTGRARAEGTVIVDRWNGGREVRTDRDRARRGGGRRAPVARGDWRDRRGHRRRSRPRPSRRSRSPSEEKVHADADADAVPCAMRACVIVVHVLCLSIQPIPRSW